MRATTVAGAWLCIALWSSPARAEGPSGEDGKPEAPPPAQAPAAQKEEDEVVARDYYFMSDELIRNKDGTLTWFYATEYVGASALKQSLDGLAIPGLKIATRTRDVFKFKYTSRDQRISLDTPTDRSSQVDENVLLLTFRPEYKDIVEEFVQRFDVPEPQVHLKARVVEITLDSNLEYGVSWFFDRGGGDASTGTIGGENPNAFFRAFRSQFRPTSFTKPPLSPENTGLSLLFDDLTTDEGTIIATIEALQERGSAHILSEPSIVATQGQLATLVTGEQTPIQNITISGSSEQITTTYKQTGITLDFQPLHIGNDYVRLRVRVEASSITGFVEARSTNFVVLNPTIAQRNAESVVTIRDGMTLIIGGLYAVSEIDTKAGVPILADIPVLSFLFSKTRKTKVKNELDFFITPIILKHRLSKAVFIPPGERERLKQLREGRDEEDTGNTGHR